ncbi:hypothetical protein SprV_0200782200 [Sparganum proliferum]
MAEHLLFSQFDVDGRLVGEAFWHNIVGKAPVKEMELCIDQNLSEAVRELKADTEIVILPADKGRSTVILGKVDYRHKALMHLNDRQSYKVSDAASLKSLVAKVKRILAGQKKDKVIAVKGCRKAQRHATSKLRRGDGQPTAQNLIELMGHCLKTFFTYEGIIYEQIKGTPMGSPLSGLIAEAALQKLEGRLLEEYKPTFWARNVDDTFVLIDRDRINCYEELLNSIIPDQSLPMEEEVGDKLPFVDILVCRQPNGKLATSVYRKPTNTLQMLSYNSNHPLQH